MAKTVLITGISGFIAKHVAVEFINAGYTVRGTVRSKARAEEVADTLAKYGDASKVTFVEADLDSDTGWDEAVKGCHGVAHVASPFPLAQPKDENELIKPAVDGTLRVLKAAIGANVERFVQTSSMVAIVHGYGHSKTSFNEDDWSKLDGPGATPYTKSKTLAEKAGRDFVAEHGGSIHYSTVNPGLVLGPSLDSRIGSSLEVVQMLLTGKYPGAPKIDFAAVDVRDIAKMHRLAMETSEPSGGRYAGVADVVSMIELSNALRKQLGDRAKKVPKFELPNFMVKLVAIFDPSARTIVPELGIKWTMDNSRTRKALGIEFIPVEEAAAASGRSLIEHNLV